jgi:hypothetical protein
MREDLGRSIVAAALGLAVMSIMVLAPAIGRKNHPASSQAWADQAVDANGQDMPLVALIENWPAAARKNAESMIVEYGSPDHTDEASLVWYNNGPWKKTVVYREAVFEGEDDSKPVGVLQQTITYHVPEGRFASLDGFTRSLVGDPSRDELSFRSDSEKKNFLAINLAHEIVGREKTVDEARDFYDKQIRLMEAGKTSRYTMGFLFPVDNENAKRE